MVKISPTIDAIKKETQNTLTSYFSDLSREFDTDFSGNVKDIAVSANANHPTDDIVKAFDLETPETLATMYANAAGSIKNDTHVAMMVFGSARKLGMNPEHLDLS